jgi:choline-glycine betaine transporter
VIFQTVSVFFMMILFIQYAVLIILFATDPQHETSKHTVKGLLIPFGWLYLIRVWYKGLK